MASKPLSTPPITLLPPADDALNLRDLKAIRQAFKELQNRPLPDSRAIEAWLADWSTFMLRLYDAMVLAKIEWTRDNMNKRKKALHEHCQLKVAPILRVADNKLNRKLLATGWTSPSMRRPIRRLRTEVKIFRLANVALLSQDDLLANEYGEKTGSLTAQFDGEERTVTQIVNRYMLSQDRDVREQAWRTGFDLFRSVRPDLDVLFDGLVKLRTQIARNAGFNSYRGYRWMDFGRLDYTLADTLSFHQATLSTAVPAVTHRYEARRQLLGLEILRPWDLGVDLYGASMKPFQTGKELAD